VRDDVGAVVHRSSIATGRFAPPGARIIQTRPSWTVPGAPASALQAETHPDNRASQRVLEKAGFQLEGRLRRTVFSRGRWRDTLMCSLLRDEWQGPRLLLQGAA
jgi:hypothetical protein